MKIEYPFYCIEVLYDLGSKCDSASAGELLLGWISCEGFENLRLVVFKNEERETVLSASMHGKFAINLHFTDGITIFTNKGYKI